MRLKAGTNLDYETANQHLLTVEVDNGLASETATITVEVTNIIEADADGDGLIEIFSLTRLHNMRYDLDGSHYRTNDSDVGDDFGCPDGGCFGYELISNLSFDANGNGHTWSGSNGSYRLDSEDSAPPYFVVANGGWEPIDNFSATFEGNSNTITGLAVLRDTSDNVGMFGSNYNGHIFNLGLVSNLAHGRNIVGGLIGDQNQGYITSCYTTGHASGNSNVGGLVGDLNLGSTLGIDKYRGITASYATGDVSGSNNVGGLVGWQDRSSILLSYATGDVSGTTGGSGVGGLVGNQNLNASITASYATGDVSGSNNVGGLVGAQTGANSSITASYATGDVSGNDGVGGLVGGAFGSITASYAIGDASGRNNVGGLVGGAFVSITTNNYGFGLVMGGSGIDGDPPLGVSNATQLTLSNAGSAWSNATLNTAGAWDFGDSTMAPRLLFNDYDGSGDNYGCSGTPPALVPNCGRLIPGQ